MRVKLLLTLCVLLVSGLARPMHADTTKPEPASPLDITKAKDWPDSCREYLPKKISPAASILICRRPGTVHRHRPYTRTLPCGLGSEVRQSSFYITVPHLRRAASLPRQDRSVAT
jgi:hypothetical protein